MKNLICALGALLAAVLISCAAPARAANCPNYPYTLVNGQTADATQVMANFASILTCSNVTLAKQGANSDITSIGGLTTPLSMSQGGTGATTTSGFNNLLPFEFYVFVGGTTGNAWTLANYVPSTSLLLTTAKSACVVGVAATASTTYTLKDNGSSIGTAVISAGSTTCAATITSSPYTVPVGHTLSVTGPATGDATAADIGLTFGGNRN